MADNSATLMSKSYHFPVEIWMMIVAARFEDHDIDDSASMLSRRRDLAALSCVSRTSTKTAQSALWQAVYITTIAEAAWFIRLLLRSPRLAGLVEAVHVDNPTGSEVMRDQDRQGRLNRMPGDRWLTAAHRSMVLRAPIPPAMHTELQRTIRAFGHALGMQRLPQQAIHDFIDMQLILIAAACPSLRSLYANLAWSVQPDANTLPIVALGAFPTFIATIGAAHMLAGAPPYPAPLAHLTSLTLSPAALAIGRGYAHQDFGMLEDLCKPPGLVQFKSSGFMLAPDNVRPGARPCPGLRSLMLSKTLVETGGLASLIQLYPGLQELDISPRPGQGGNRVFQRGDRLMARFGQALRQLGTNLRVLRLRGWDAGPPDHSQMYMGDLRSLMHLEELEIPIAALVLFPTPQHFHLAQVLPPSLQQLTTFSAHAAHFDSEDRFLPLLIALLNSTDHFAVLDKVTLWRKEQPETGVHLVVPSWELKRAWIAYPASVAREFGDRLTWHKQ